MEGRWEGVGNRGEGDGVMGEGRAYQEGRGEVGLDKAEREEKREG